MSSAFSGVVIKWVSTSLPSMPLQRKVSWGMRLYWFQLILVVMNISMPLFFRICGRAQL
ncbi:hypothetical protein D3C76_1840490 [compost metagenome]